MVKKSSTAYVWFDTEFTSLDLDEAQLLQVSVMLTDKDLKRLTLPEEDLNLYIRLSDTEPVSAWVEKHLPDLLRKCRSRSAVPVEEVDAKLTDYIDRWCGTPTKTIQKRPLMAGNSVHNDWILSRKFFGILLRVPFLRPPVFTLPLIPAIVPPSSDMIRYHSASRRHREPQIANGARNSIQTKG